MADKKKLAQSGKFSSTTLFVEGSMLHISSQKIKNHQIKSGQNTKCDIIQRL